MRTLQNGTSGADVRRVQQFLAHKRYYNGEVDGRYGPKTMAAVIAYQSAHDLQPDGICGRLTLAAMMQEGLDVVLDVDREIPQEPDWLKPITDNQGRMRKWGRFDYRPAPMPDNPEGIIILGGWEEANIVHVECPILGEKVSLHKGVVDDYLAFMEDVIKAGFADRILTNDGAFNARFIRGSRTVLSNHAWGTAFDRNADWNALGCTPAYVGERGSLREIVSIGNRHNWYWGGHYKNRRDGMHFEHV